MLSKRGVVTKSGVQTEDGNGNLRFLEDPQQPIERNKVRKARNGDPPAWRGV